MIPTKMKCCAFEELGELQDYDDPKKYMLDLCKHIWPDRRLDFYGDVSHPSAFYIFNGVIRKKRAKWDYFDGNISMVDRFAKFIRRHKLGVLKAGPARYNRVNEPGHLVKGYIWAPSERNLWRWYQKNRTKV